MALVTTATMSHRPSDNNGKSQLDTDADATNVQDTEVSPGLEAVTVTVLPATTPEISIFGVTSFVRLSVEDTPVSDVLARSGFAEATGATVSIVILNAELGEETLPAGSVTIAVTLHVPSVKVNNSQPDEVGVDT